MNSQEIRALQEAYNQVHKLDEASPSNPNLYKGKQGQTSTQYMAGRSDAGKIISGDDKSGPLGYSNRYINDEPTQPGQRTTTQRTSKSMKAADLEYGRLRYKQSVKDGNKFGGPKGLPKPKGGGSTAQSASGGRSGGYTVGGSQGYGISGIKLADSFDLYDIILSHLLDEGYADTEQAAEAIMVNMSEDWRESIVEATYRPSGSAAPTDTPVDTRKTVTAADKAGNTKAYQNFKAGDPAYKAASHLQGV